MKRRLPALSAITSAVFVLALLGVFHSQIAALLWHLQHGRDVSWDGHTVTVPMMWIPSFDKGERALILRHSATFGAEHEIVFVQETASVDAPHWQKATADIMNSKASTATFQPYTVVTDGGDTFCVGSGPRDLAASFVCKVSGSNLDVRFLGTSDDVLDARAIVGSLR